MQLYIVTWKFESSEDQNYSSEAFVDYVESGKSEQFIDGYESCLLYTSDAADE